MQRLNAWLDRDERRSLLLALLALAALCGLIFGQQLGALGLMDKTEGLFVEIPREMLVSGDWGTPRWNGELFFDYPVWGYWMVALSFRLFGVSEWAARLPVALAATATAYAVFAVLMLVAPVAEAAQSGGIVPCPVPFVLVFGPSVSSSSFWVVPSSGLILN